MPTVRQNNIDIPCLHPNQESYKDYTDVLLSHAQLYVFAEKYYIPILQTLVIENLQQVLIIFTLYAERTKDIIALLRYVYTNTKESNGVSKDLRTLIIYYVGYEMDILIRIETFGT